MPDWDAVCAAIGHGGLKEGQVVGRLIEAHENDAKKNMTDEEALEKMQEESAVNVAKVEAAKRRRRGQSNVVLAGQVDMEIEPRYSKCCGPVPGDRIVAFVTRGRGTSIHREDCINITNAAAVERPRIVQAQWAAHEGDEMFFRADVKVICDNRIGMLLQISAFLAGEGVNIANVNSRLDRDTAVIDIGFNIKNRAELESISNRMRKIGGVRNVLRTQ
jgi:GTP pyrophosphokinase